MNKTETNIAATDQHDFQTQVLKKRGCRYAFQNRKGYVFERTGRPTIYTWVR